ncbi:MAG: hypothetical protein FWE19_00035 [Oscillospiraceae bacterium]|nr:hypothetical protein [Oscillospiraceae bacterium]
MSRRARIAWGITGAGHFLEDCVKLILAHEQCDVFLSRAGLQVLKLHGLYRELQDCGHEIFLDEDAAGFRATRLYGGRYDLVVIAPATSNTVAKMVAAIADGLVTSLFATAGKCKIPAVILPCDVSGEVVSTTHKGKEIRVHVRPIDQQNTEALASFEGVRVVHSPNQLAEVISNWPGPDAQSKITGG